MKATELFLHASMIKFEFDSWKDPCTKISGFNQG